ncbi:MAG: ATPase domain-containing protein [archaeon]
MVERIPTGIEGFDELIQNGLVKGSTVLVSGGPGTGKSIFCLQALYNNSLKGKKTLFITFEQSPERVLMQMEQFGWKPKELKNLEIVFLDNSSPTIVEEVFDLIKKSNCELLAIDSVSSILSSPLSRDTPVDIENINRLRTKQLFNLVLKSNITAFFINEIVYPETGIKGDGLSEFLCDGIIVLKALAISKTFHRTIQVAKLRYTDADCSIKAFNITKDGVILD